MSMGLDSYEQEDLADLYAVVRRRGNKLWGVKDTMADCVLIDQLTVTEATELAHNLNEILHQAEEQIHQTIQEALLKRRRTEHDKDTTKQGGSSQNTPRKVRKRE